MAIDDVIRKVFAGIRLGAKAAPLLIVASCASQPSQDSATIYDPHQSDAQQTNASENNPLINSTQPKTKHNLLPPVETLARYMQQTADPAQQAFGVVYTGKIDVPYRKQDGTIIQIEVSLIYYPGSAEHDISSLFALTCPRPETGNMISIEDRNANGLDDEDIFKITLQRMDDNGERETERGTIRRQIYTIETETIELFRVDEETYRWLKNFYNTMIQKILLKIGLQYIPIPEEDNNSAPNNSTEIKQARAESQQYTPLRPVREDKDAFAQKQEARFRAYERRREQRNNSGHRRQYVF